MSCSATGTSFFVSKCGSKHVRPCRSGPDRRSFSRCCKSSFRPVDTPRDFSMRSRTHPSKPCSQHAYSTHIPGTVCPLEPATHVHSSSLKVGRLDRIATGMTAGVWAGSKPYMSTLFSIDAIDTRRASLARKEACLESFAAPAAGVAGLSGLDLHARPRTDLPRIWERGSRTERSGLPGAYKAVLQNH